MEELLTAILESQGVEDGGGTGDLTGGTLQVK
jgi:hypothetical protein